MPTTDADGFFVSQKTDNMRPFSSYLNAMIASIKNAIQKVQPTGTIVAFAGTTAPDGWYMCNGATVSKSSDPTLYNVLGTRYGTGDGSSGSFSLPDLTARMPVGAHMNTSQSTVYKYGLATRSGSEQTKLGTAHLAPHTHPQTSFTGNTGSKPIPGAPSRVRTMYTSYTPTNKTGYKQYSSGGTTGSTGNGTPFSNMPPYLALNYIIKR